MLPLPSDGWAEFADAAFCHKHDENHEHSSHEHATRDSTRDCLVGKYFIVISKTMLHHSAVMEDSNMLQCHRCRHTVGCMYTTGTQVITQIYVTDLRKLFISLLTALNVNPFICCVKDWKKV